MRPQTSLARLFLLIAALGLAPVALSYGSAPARSLPWLFGIDASGVNAQHAFRAIMGLYLGMIVFWIVGAVQGGLSSDTA